MKKKLIKDIKFFLKKKKKKSQHYGSEHYKNLSGDEKRKLVEYSKKKLWNEKKSFSIIIRKYLSLENFGPL